MGCGAGALTPRCDVLITMDCTAGALAVARARASLAGVAFVAGAAPGDWPAQAPDLVVLSEVLCFMTDAESAGLARRLSDDCAEGRDVVLVNWLGDTGGAIGGAAAARRLIDALAGTHRLLDSRGFDRFRIDGKRRRRYIETLRAEG